LPQEKFNFPPSSGLAGFAVSTITRGYDPTVEAIPTGPEFGSVDPDAAATAVSTHAT